MDGIFDQIGMEVDLSKFGAFQGLRSEDLAVINNNTNLLNFKKGDIVFTKDAKLKGLYCIQKGTIKAYKIGPKGRNQIFSLIRESEIVGYDSVLNSSPPYFSASSVSNSVIVFIPAVFVKSLFESNHLFRLNVLKIACYELNNANIFFTDIIQKTSEERLIDLLINLNDK